MIPRWLILLAVSAVFIVLVVPACDDRAEEAFITCSGDGDCSRGYCLGGKCVIECHDGTDIDIKHYCGGEGHLCIKNTCRKACNEGNEGIEEDLKVRCGSMGSCKMIGSDWGYCSNLCRESAQCGKYGPEYICMTHECVSPDEIIDGDEDEAEGEAPVVDGDADPELEETELPETDGAEDDQEGELPLVDGDQEPEQEASEDPDAVDSEGDAEAADEAPQA